MKVFTACFLIFILASCQEIIEAPIPDLHWDRFDSPEAKPLSAQHRSSLEGIYTIGYVANDFGKEAALKWSYVATGSDTTYYLSFFCSEDVRYFICQGKRLQDTIFLNGYWRNIENTKTGKAHFILPVNHGRPPDDKLVINGWFGIKDNEPQKQISFTFLRPLYHQKPYSIIAHRGGGRNNDLLPASENSVEMIPLAAQLGANGIEIDVQLTKDSVPVLFHDANVNDRLTTKTGIHGAIDQYTWHELDTDVLLKRGGKVPTLQQALDTVLYKTPLEFVWLDCKYKTVLPKVRELQAAILQKAKAAGRKLEVLIGIPDEEVWKGFMQLPGYKNIPSLCELDTAKAYSAGAKIWAPGWVKGHQDDIVAAVQKKGMRSFIWTVDIPDKIKEFMYRAQFNGIVTNRPTMAAYYYYSQQ